MIWEAAWARDPSNVDGTGLWAQGIPQHRSRPRCTTGLSAREQSQVPAKLRGQLACIHSVKPTFLLRVAVRKRPPGNNPWRDYCLHLLNHAWRLLVTVGQRQLQPFNSNNKSEVPRPKNVPSTVSFPQTFPSGDIQTEHIQRTQVLDGDFSKVFASWLSWKNCLFKNELVIFWFGPTSLWLLNTFFFFF